MTDLGVAEAEADGGLRAEAVGRGEDDQTAARADQGGAGPQQLVEGLVQRTGARQSFGQVVQGAEVGDPAGQPVLDGGELVDDGDVGGGTGCGAGGGAPGRAGGGAGHVV